MSQIGPQSGCDSTTTPLSPPAYAPTTDMRQGYLDRRRAEMPLLLDSAKAGAWKQVLTVMNHVRGTGAMYGFPAVGEAAESLVRSGDGERLERLEEYALAVGEAKVE